MIKDDKTNEFRWESGYEKSWSVIREDKSGCLITTLEHFVHDAHSKIRKSRQRIGVGSAGFVKLGMVRHVILILDLSQAMHEQDLKPNRLNCTIKATSVFVRDFFDQNPLSQLGIIITCDKRAERLTELSGNPRQHLTALQSLYTRNCFGEPSLQNALVLAESRLKYMPHHNEIIVIMASLTTCDPGDIHQTIQTLVASQIQCSVISLAVEVFVYRALAQLTKGSFFVVLDELHLKSILKDLVPPPAAPVETEAILMRMGFPHTETFDLDRFSTKRCLCHLSNRSFSPGDITNPQYACPRCRAAYCALPIECISCGLTLVAAPHLARAYHHLFPLDLFESEHLTHTSDVADEKPSDDTLQSMNEIDKLPVCAGCNIQLPIHLPVYRCTKCKSIFCHACDSVLHDSVHSCPCCLVSS